MSDTNRYIMRTRETLHPLAVWLRANSLGPALTVTVGALISIFLIPQLTFWVVNAPKFVLFEVLSGAPLVPYAVYRIHRVSWKVLTALWALVYIVGLATPPAPLRGMAALAISAHFTGWFLWGFAATGALAFFWRSGITAPTAKKRDVTSLFEDMSKLHKTG